MFPPVLRLSAQFAALFFCSGSVFICCETIRVAALVLMLHEVSCLKLWEFGLQQQLSESKNSERGMFPQSGLYQTLAQNSWGLRQISVAIFALSAVMWTPQCVHHFQDVMSRFVSRPWTMWLMFRPFRDPPSHWGQTNAWRGDGHMSGALSSGPDRRRLLASSSGNTMFRASSSQMDRERQGLKSSRVWHAPLDV